MVMICKKNVKTNKMPYTYSIYLHPRMKIVFIPAIWVLLVVFSCNNNNTENTSATTATTDIAKLAKQYPDSVILQQRYIEFLEEKEDNKTALQELEKLIIKDSNNTVLLNRKADLLYVSYDTLGAIKVFEKSIALKQDVPVLVTLGVAYAQTKNQNAIKIGNLLINAKTNLENSGYFIKGLYYSYLQKYTDAVGYFNQSLAADYRNADTYREKAIALYHLKQYENALVTLDKSLQFNPDDDEAYFLLGQNFEKLNRTQDAIDSYNTALSYDPNYQEAKEALRLIGIKK
jgi:tetratricopeptide (TPR) repeat protein